ncbi:MAG: glutamate-5-semialdehyde dehydrogenase, partial [Actinomycetia bacterium]|nr:glutamate-5-semialdehyde dehydrogenase [Actinomycetes bacterium]
MSDIVELGKKAKKASLKLATATTELKNNALLSIADSLVSEKDYILSENKKDLEVGEKQKTSSALMDRLILTEKRIHEMAKGLKEVVALPDPVGEILAGWKRPNGLTITKVRVPIGVLAIIYEARPNVTVDAAGLALKSGNALILRGSSVAINSNLALTRVISESAEKAGLPKDSVQSIKETSREAAQELMRLNKYVDVLIPRGGEGLIKTVVENSTVPVIETGLGNCHVYVDKDADLDMALDIVINSKCHRPGVCNAAETLLVHENIAESFMPKIILSLKEKGVEIFGCEKTRNLVTDINVAKEEDWYREYLDLKIAVKIVKGVKEAVDHINHYGTQHSEAIVTENYSSGKYFTENIDSSSLYINASTRFTDGSQFGMGAEIGISTQKLHARGPMALPELTTIKFIIYGTGQI